MLKTKIAGLFFVILTLAAHVAHAGEAVIYYDGDTVLEGYWAQSSCASDPARAPVVMIVHQWKGPGAHERARADALTAKCYNAFVVDIYGRDVRPESNQEAGALAGRYKKDPGLSRRRLDAAVSYIRKRQNGGNSSKIAAIGYCFGGTMVLDYARGGADIAGVVSFHGGLGSAAPLTAPGIIRAAVQVHHGAADPHVPPAEVDAFMKEMDEAGADWSLTQYADAVHAFTEKGAGSDPSKGVAYNEKADRRSWEAAAAFLDEVLKNP